jgi:hypothetical protein
MQLLHENVENKHSDARFIVQSKVQEQRHGPGGSRGGASGMEAVGEALTWTRWRWRWRGIVVGGEEEQARDVDSAAVKEAVGEVLAWTRRWSGRC